MQFKQSAFCLGAVLLGVFVIAPAEVRAANAGDRDKLRMEAEAFERKGEWGKAGEIYSRLLAEDRQSIALRKKLLHCSRHVQLVNRHRDRLYLERIRNLSMSQALNAYLDALGKLQSNYVDRDRIGLAALFASGLEEFGFALADSSFNQEHLAEAEPDSVQLFAEELREKWSESNFRQPAEARQAVREIATAAQNRLGLRPSVTVLEFVCGACNALDEQTGYLPPSDEMATLTSQLSAAGARLSASADGQLYVEQVMPGSWAASVGLKAGERIVRLGRGDGEHEDSSLLVEIDTLGRDDSMPRTIKLPPLLSSVLDVELRDGVGYLRLSGFLKNSPQDLEEAVLNLKMRGMRALILDMRGNAGGLFGVAVQIAERFIPEGIIVSTHGQAGPFNRIYSSRSGMGAWDMALYVLVDGDTASAAEMLAGALKENRRATVIGQPTYGKGTMQQVLQLAAGGGVRITLARFFAPGGQAYSGVGVVPQVIVPAAQAREEAFSQAVRMLMMQP